jgi:cobalt-precorrin-5B (C1)-methyltransferase
VPDFVDCVLPNTQRVRFAITGGWTDGRRARAVSIKDAGDDPDATNGAHLTAEVERLPGAAGQIVLRGGPGSAWSPSRARPGGRRPGHQPGAPPQHHRQRARPPAPILEAGDGLA